MPLDRTSDQMVGADLEQVLVASAPFAVGNWHVAPTGGPPPFGMKSGLVASDGLIGGAGKFLQLIIDITNINGAGTATITIFGYDPASAKFYPLLVSTALAAVATTVLRVGPGLTVAANLVASDFVPLAWAVQVVIATNPVNLSIGSQQMY